jgi:hypothetical protein
MMLVTARNTSSQSHIGSEEFESVYKFCRNGDLA